MFKLNEISNCSYSENLINVINKLNGVYVLFLYFEDSWSGEVDIDVFLKDGRVASYRYSYGSCPCCDEWEGDDLTNDEIEKEMLNGFTFFENLKSYKKWIEMMENDTSRGKERSSIIEKIKKCSEIDLNI